MGYRINAPVLILLVGIIILSPGCGPAGGGAEPPNATARATPGPAATAKVTSEAEWEKVLAEGQREGTVVIYTVLESGIRETTRSRFKERYGTDLEFKDNLILGPMDKELLLPEVKNPNAWVDGVIPFIDKGRFMLSYMVEATNTRIANIEMIRAEEVASYKDLLNPKWKGKMTLVDLLTRIHIPMPPRCS